MTEATIAAVVGAIPAHAATSSGASLSLLDVAALLLAPVGAIVIGLGVIRYAKWADRRAH